MKISRPYLITFLMVFYSLGVKAQEDKDYLNKDVDLIDIARDFLKKQHEPHEDTTGKKNTTKMRISAVPAAGYTLQTGFAVLASANAAFYTSPDAKTSSVLTSLTYTARNQVIFPFQTSIWTKNNKYNIIGDWRYLYYPSYTYGLGGFTTLADGYLINYSAARIHQTVLRKLKLNMYAGIGYNFDYFWNIKELNPPSNLETDFQKYELAGITGKVNNTEIASGLTFNFLYDSRENSINPEGGEFINIIYRPNLVAFGNTTTWRSLVFDMRKYVRLSKNSRNVLAFWSYDWLTVNGKPPYLMLPNTGSDPYSNTGRGYIQGRFRGANMVYVEGEYRFALTPNGLLGGVVFANAQSFTETANNRFETIAPGWGGGIRVKLNKFSRTNLCLDYGFGLGGSQGLFVNLGEVF